MPTPFGYAVGVSDIQVSFPDGKRLDCLQKIYPVTRWIAAGFAGSVIVGFRMMQDLREAFSNIASDEAWMPRYAAFKWYRRARRIFGTVREEHRARGCSIILLGVSPQANLGLPNCARADVIVMESKNGFEPQICARRGCLAIGSGNDADEYASAVREIAEDNFFLMQWEIGDKRGGMGSALGTHLALTLMKHPVLGVSRYVQQVTVSRGDIRIGQHVMSEFEEDGTEIVHTPPPIAASWGAYEKIVLLSGFGKAAAAGAVA